MLYKGVESRDYMNWSVRGQRIYFVDRQNAAEAMISVFDGATGRVRAVMPLQDGIDPYRTRIDLSPDESWLCYSIVESIKSEIMVAEL